jgi:quinol monooxygenase YgiN
MKTLTVIAILKAKPGKEAALREALLGLIPITRQEPGCINYDLHVSTEKPGEFVFHENWESKQHLDDHLARPHLVALAERADELFSEPPHLTLCERIG